MHNFPDSLIHTYLSLLTLTSNNFSPFSFQNVIFVNLFQKLTKTTPSSAQRLLPFLRKMKCSLPEVEEVNKTARRYFWLHSGIGRSQKNAPSDSLQIYSCDSFDFSEAYAISKTRILRLDVAFIFHVSELYRSTLKPHLGITKTEKIELKHKIDEQISPVNSLEP